MPGVYVSALELFSIGIGPSSSHTVGPMRAGSDFIRLLKQKEILAHTNRLSIGLYGSLAATGIGHGTPDAVLAGLRGLQPETCCPSEVHGHWDRLVAGETLIVEGIPISAKDIFFEPYSRDLEHPNILTLAASDGDRELLSERYLSVGGGFVVRSGELSPTVARVPSQYRTASELLKEVGTGTIADLAWTDEVALHGESPAREGLDAIWKNMQFCINHGLSTHGTLPGSLKVRRRAGTAASALERRTRAGGAVAGEEWLTVWAMAVNEENAAGERVVTAPTNGAAGVIPAVLQYLVSLYHANRHDIHTFLLTAAAIGSIIKANASISGAEAGCQGEVGSACAMAAAGTVAILGGTPLQVENAAEIAMEHHLGLTCDPVAGLVQIPCIERNAVAAATALTAARIALLGDGKHIVSLDIVIETMRQTGADMSSRYKETSEAGLAVNVVEC